MSRITHLSALEILDSRGRPTVKAQCILDGGYAADASVPSGASTGTAEAIELRDGDPQRFNGLGCRKAVEHVNHTIRQALVQQFVDSQRQLDQVLLDLDGTPNKSHLGANALLAVSLAFARAQANERHQPLYRQFADMLGTTQIALPRPTINLFSGGKHAGGQVPIQDVLVVPITAETMDQALNMTYAVYQAAISLSAR